MSAVLAPRIEMLPMNASDLDDVLAIENTVYPLPWTRGNFADSLAAGYSAWVCRIGGELVGYAVIMMVLDEAHLLNISVDQSRHGMGFGARLLRHAMAVARTLGARMLLLEVRPSNERAPALPALRLRPHRRAQGLLSGARRARGCAGADAFTLADGEGMNPHGSRCWRRWGSARYGACARRNRWRRCRPEGWRAVAPAPDNRPCESETPGIRTAAPGSTCCGAIGRCRGDARLARNCADDCRLYRLRPLPQRKQAVPGVGDENADWLFIGEGPGPRKMPRRAFVGQAGKLLDAMLAAIDLERGHNVTSPTPSNAVRPATARRKPTRWRPAGPT